MATQRSTTSKEKDFDFHFWVPAEISKSKEKTATGKEKWVFKGIASTADVDTDGETLLPDGFDLSYFLSDGFVNWNHQSKNNPSAIIGEPTKAEIRPEGMYVETQLYKASAVAKSVWDLGQILDKSNSNRKLGFSIEGKVLARDPNDEKKITKAKITGLAITPSPKNKATFADILTKGEVFAGEWEFDIEKSDLSIEGEFIVDIIDEEGTRVTVDKGLNINIVKGGEGSRGGKIIGHTTSGKPVYATNAKNIKHKDFTVEDHLDAAAVNEQYADKNKSDKVKSKTHKELADEHEKEANRKHSGDEGYSDDPNPPEPLYSDDPKHEKKKKKKDTEKSLDTESGAAITPSNFSNANPHFKEDKKNLKNLENNLETSSKTLNLKKNLTKSEVFENIFLTVTTDLEKAEKIYKLIETIELKNSNTMKVKEISLDSINQAYAALGVDLEKGEPSTTLTDSGASMAGDANGYSVDMVMGMYKAMDAKDKKDMMSKAIEKGVTSDMAEKAYNKAVEKGILKAEDKEEDDKEDAEVKKAEDEMKKAEENFKAKKDSYDEMKKKGEKAVKKDGKEKDDKEDGDKAEKGDKKIKKSEKDDLVKALAETGSLVKQLAEQNNTILKAMGTQKDEFSKALEDANKKIDELEKTPAGRRSIQTTQFLEKGLQDEIKKAEGEGKTVINLNSSSDSKKFLNMLEKKAVDIEKGTTDSFYANVMCQMEYGGHIAMSTLKQKGVAEKIQNDLNVKLIMA